MLKPDQIESAAGSLVSQRLSSAPVDLAEDMRPADEVEAYAVQAEVNRRLSQSGLGLPVGHKIGCTTPVMQAYLGISNPCAGEIFAATTVQSHGQVSRARYRRLGVECEIVIGLSRDVAPEEAPFTREGMASWVDAVMAGIEIVDDRYRDYRSLGAPTLIADNFFNAGCVLGEPIRDWRRTRSRSARRSHAHQRPGSRSRRWRHDPWSSLRSAGLARQLACFTRPGSPEGRIRISRKRKLSAHSRFAEIKRIVQQRNGRAFQERNYGLRMRYAGVAQPILEDQICHSRLNR